MIKKYMFRVLPVFLAAALQVMPLLRSLVPTVTQGLTPSAWSIILKLSAGTVALMGSYHAVSGASTAIVPLPTGYTLYLTNGVFFKTLLTTSPDSAGSWSTNNIANGGTAAFQLFPNFSLTNSSGKMGGIPSLASGILTNNTVITAWEGGNNTLLHTYTNFTFIVFSATPGALTVTSSPPAVATLANSLTWNLDGGPWRTNGITNIYVLPGSHVVNFTNIYGWQSPAAQNITVTSSALTTVSTTYTQLFGGLQVNVQPVGTPLTSGRWTVDGSGSFTSGTVSNLAMAGTHSLTFSAVSGFTTPATQTITVTNGTTNVISAVYLSTTAGNLLVNLSPAGANSAGAMWQADNNGIWLPTGVVTNLPAGSHTISFASLSGWTTPGNQVVTLTNGVLGQLAATYVVAPTGAVLGNLAPAGAVTAGAQWQVDGGALQNSGAVVSGLNAGSHTIAFKAVSGWVTPASATPTIVGGATNTVTGTYVQITAPVITNFTLIGTNLTLKGSGTSGAGFSVLSSNTLLKASTTWPVIYTNTITNGTFIYQATVNPASKPTGFYRVSSQ